MIGFLGFRSFYSMNYIAFFSIFSIFFVFYCLPVQAFKPFRESSYISFDMPETWECKSFGTDWVCHSRLQEKKVEALITSTAKVAGPNDTLDEYLAYLQQPKTWSNVKKEQIISTKVAEAKKVFINKFPWVDSIHKNSEVKSYISRYAGTVCCKNSSSQLGILVVLSAHQDHYTKYSGDFVKTINSLRVLDIEKAIPKIRAAQAAGDGGAGMSDYLEGLFDDSSSADLNSGESKGKIFGMKPSQLALLAVVFLIVLFVLFTKSRKGRRRKRSRSKRR